MGKSKKEEEKEKAEKENKQGMKIHFPLYNPPFASFRIFFFSICMFRSKNTHTKTSEAGIGRH